MKPLLIAFFLMIPCCLFSQETGIKNLDGSSVAIEYILQDYIQIPSVSGNEKKAGDFLKEICRNNDLHIADFGSEDGQYNFAASVFPLSTRKPNIIFLNHIDVVPESKSELREPFSGDIEDGIIYGRGTIDNKGAAMMQLYGIIKAMKDEKVYNSPYNFTFLAVSCEETQCEGGVSWVHQNYFSDLNPVAVLGEGPSELTSLMEGDFKQQVFGISVVHKKPLWLELTLEHGTNGHGSITPLTYANKELVEALQRLTRKKPKAVYNDINTQFLKDMAEHHKGGKKIVLRHPRLFRPALTPQLRKHPELFSLFTNTITLTNIYSNSKSVNKIASMAGAQLDCRLLPETNEYEFIGMIRKRLKNDNIKIRVIKKMPSDVISSTNTVFYKNLSAAIQRKYPQARTMSMMMPNVNDLGSFRAKKIPSYGTLPIIFDTEEVRSVHGKDEHLHIHSLYDGADVFENFIKKMSREEI
ncbi:M20/M25/M40 family metallo-hydrolase [Lutimonas saemankumensis]|uniref:M20/M25/M40 family metallo-hydrolase n=1 Tax=Lutimonas saemankumensis TaxID=483016 RepID=UPI001CD1F377|nr:M20/M25/M40 family metallo-hydrolase [Lutimonas saemankumensis]MCA0931701.1 M20/M25/M40 family metallo-hydrolase [Lutimonas saemankumensis]